MPTVRRGTGRSTWTAVRLMLLFTVLLGVLYPLAVTGIGAVAFAGRADGSLVRAPDGRVVGSALLGQSFTDPAGHPLRRYFQPRPSAAGDGYDASASSGSNAGPEDADLVAAIRERRAHVAAFNGVAPAQVSVDAVTASGSGLDPDISPAYAQIQIDRVAHARGLPVGVVRALVADHTRGRDLGYLGQPRVAVLTLNLALDERED